MTRKATKAVGNRYYEARMNAAKYNNKLLTRAGAIDYLPGVTEDSLKKYELDINRPPNIVVALMAEAYNEPELRLWYCANECKLGNYCRDVHAMPAERALIRLQNMVYGLGKLTRKLSMLLDCEDINEKDRDAIPEMKDLLLEFRRRTDENLVILEKACKTGKLS